MSGIGIPESLRARRAEADRPAPAEVAGMQQPPLVANDPARSPRPLQAGAAPRVKSRRIGFTRRIGAWWEHHLQALFNTLGRIARTPLSSLMTIAVLGIALALPTGLHVILHNLQTLSQGWDDAAQISLFMRKDLDDAAIRRIAGEIAALPEVADVSHVTPSQALDEFQRLSGFGNALDALQENPLPALIIVRPAAENATPAQVEALLDALRERGEVDLAQLDMEWVERLYAIMEIGKRGVLVLAVLLALAVLLIIGNTIRLAIQNRREEIVVQKLIGATDGFIRRPFLYSGLLYGLFGAVFAWILVTTSLWLLDGPVQRLSVLYNSPFALDRIGLEASAVLVAGGILLGLAGAWLAVGRHLREIEPS
jgi:cell division transport system permease protein